MFRPPSRTRVTIGRGERSGCPGPRLRVGRGGPEGRRPRTRGCPRVPSCRSDPGSGRLRGRVQAEHDHVAAEADVGVADPPAAGDALVVDRRVGRGHAYEPGIRPIPPGRHDQALDVLVGCRQADHRERRDLGDVARRDGAVGRRLARADADVLAVDGDDVRAEPLDARGDLGRGARAHGIHGDQRGHADDDAERRQNGAKPVRP